jgi:hypothetical protein
VTREEKVELGAYRVLSGAVREGWKCMVRHSIDILIALQTSEA